MKKIKLNDVYQCEKDGVKVLLTDSPETKAAVEKRNHNKKVRKAVGWSIFAALLFVLVLNVLIMPLTSQYARVDGISSYDGYNSYITFDETPLISAHRAGGDLAPEETLMAFEKCMHPAEGYRVDIVEFDLHITRDKQLVLLHDNTVDRTSNAVEHFGKKKNKAIDYTLEQLKQLNFGESFVAVDGSAPYKGLRGADIPENIKILELDEILKYLTGERADLNYIIEIKDGGKDGEQAMDILYSKLVKYGIVERTIVGTFQDNVTRYIDKNYDNLTRSASIIEVLNFYYAFLYGVKQNPDKLSFNVLQIPQGLAMFNLGTKAFIDYAHSYEIAVQYWTINEPDDVRRLIEAGADAIMTDNPEVAYGVLQSA